MKNSAINKVLCALMICCQVFTFTLTVRAEDEHRDSLVSPTFIYDEKKELT